jgi:hypothetical protein
VRSGAAQDSRTREYSSHQDRHTDNTNTMKAPTVEAAFHSLLFNGSDY